MTRSRILALALLTFATACSGGGGDGTGTTPPTSDQKGSITGQVTASGSGVSGAQVALPGASTQTTDGGGQFTFNNVNPGSYTLTVTLPAGYTFGSGEAASKPATVATGQAATVNWSLNRTAPTETMQVDLQATSFSPSDVTISRGSTIRWVNRTATTHNITPNNAGQSGAWSAPTVSGSGTEFTHTFSETGSFPYHCTLHSGMTGTIKVQ